MSEYSKEYLTSLKLLCGHYGVVVPDSASQKTVRRLFTLLVRQEQDIRLLDDELRVALETVGATLPQVNEDGTYSCFGVLHREKDRCCSVCSLQEACKTATINVGLDEVTLLPGLISGAKLQRVPVLSDETKEASQQLFFLTDLAEALDAYLNEHYKRMAYLTESHFIPFVETASPGPCFRQTNNGGDIYFEKPSLALRELLVRDKRGFKLNDTLSYDEARSLIERHVQERSASLSQ